MAKAKTVPITIGVPMDKYVREFAEHLKWILSEDFYVNLSVKQIMAKVNFVEQVQRYVLDVLAERATEIEVEELSYDIDFEKIFKAEIAAAEAKAQALEEKEQANRDVPIRVIVKGRERTATEQKLRELGFEVN